MTEPMTQEQFIKKLLKTGEAMRDRLLVLVEAGEETGCQMRLEKDAIEAWDGIFDHPNLVWHTGITVSPVGDLPPILKFQAPK